MLVELQIENLALIRAACVPFTGRLNVLTGETGAGKTLVLRALDLLRGQRAERAQLRDGAPECTVSALLHVPERLLGEIRKVITPAPLADGELLLTRVLARDGRSRSYLNGRLVPLAVLREAGSRLVDVLGQGEARRLADQEHRANLVDAFGGLLDARSAYVEAREHAILARDRRDRLTGAVLERRRRLEFLRFQQSEIREAAVERGELPRLEGEMDVLEAAAELTRLCGEGLLSLYEGEDAAIDRLARVQREIEALDGGARELLAAPLAAVDRASREIEEAVAGFRAALDRIPADPGRRLAVSERLDVLRRLVDRYGPTEDELFARANEISAAIEQLETEEEDTTRADRAVAEAVALLHARGAALDEGRRRSGREFAVSTQRELRALGMATATFATQLEPHSGGDPFERARPTGLSAVEFLLAANRGHSPQPLASVASGGESARIALALRMALSAVLDVPVLVFDEVESGVGARLGEVVGRSLKRLAGDRQVIVVTHLPQVAAFADNHVRVSKATRAGVVDTIVEVLDERQREAEIAAMMRGASAARSTRTEARALLDTAKEES